MLAGVGTFAQSGDSPRHSMQVWLGPSYHNTDLALGAIMGAEYECYVGRRFNYSVFVAATIDDGVDSVNQWFQDQVIKGAVNFTTSGLQAGGLAGFSIVRSAHHHFQISLGPLVRYQTTSNPDILGLETTFPYNNMYRENDYPARSLSLGVIGGLSYDYTFKNNVLVGLKGMLQYDSNDDGLHNVFLFIGKRF
jgi:hypothetical protein